MSISNANTEIEVLEPSSESRSELAESCSVSLLKDSKSKKAYLSVQHNYPYMHRSPLRPLFCCGSELSLISYSEDANLCQNNDQLDRSTVAWSRSKKSSHQNNKMSRKNSRSKKMKRKYAWWTRNPHKDPLNDKDSLVSKCNKISCLSDRRTSHSESGCLSCSNHLKNHVSRFRSNHKQKSSAHQSSLPGHSSDTRVEGAHSVQITHDWVCFSGVHDRRVVDQLSSSFQRGCELMDRTENNDVYQEFTDLPLIPGGSSIDGKRRSLTAHTQVDYVHYLVPDLLEISKRGYYWGVMDRYEAERLLDNKPEGTFLLRDSAQDDFLFSVSFRRYGRSLHARVDQFKHRFSFDSHDPGVFATNTVCDLIEHYKDPNCCMFFEPMLTRPLNRTFPFSLQHLCRAVICSCVTYDDVNLLPVPSPMKECIKYYHYKQKVRVRTLDTTK